MTISVETMSRVFRTNGVEAARKIVRNTGSGGEIASAFLRLQREAKEKLTMSSKNLPIVPRKGKTEREGGRSAALAKKAIKRAESKQLRTAMRGGSSSPKRK